jgi:hypothetical protein
MGASARTHLAVSSAFVPQALTSTLPPTFVKMMMNVSSWVSQHVQVANVLTHKVATAVNALLALFLTQQEDSALTPDVAPVGQP